MKYKNYDLIKAFEENEIDVLIHGCNCFCTMGAGIAKQLKRKFPILYEIDSKTQKGDRAKLGTLSVVKINDKYLVNAYTQFTYWDSSDMLSYDAIKQCMNIVKTKFTGLRIGMPKIGCGLAGGDWTIVSSIIEKINEDITIYYV